MLPKTNFERFFCFRNFKKFLLETSLHGLRFIGDSSLNFFERFFFLCAFIATVLATLNFITQIYSKFEATPIILGTDPISTSISEIPFPALTVCNMNQLVRSQVANYSPNTFEAAMVDINCYNSLGKFIPPNFKHNNLSILDFIIKHSQPCTRLLVFCKFNSIEELCSDLFHEIFTDEGRCCVFNIMHPTFRYKYGFETTNVVTKDLVYLPVNWSPETGYPKNLPPDFYPRKGSGIGPNVGLTVVLNAELDDYFCSSTNGPGFKMALHSPLDVPRIADIGFTMGVGEEHHVLITARNLYATRQIRQYSPAARNCLFSDEGELYVYKFYTRRNCEYECEARYTYTVCGCIPYNLPLVYKNASICGAPDFFCASSAANSWLHSKDSLCRINCLPSCIDISFSPSAFSAPLVQQNYTVRENKLLRNFTYSFIKDNLAIVHVYYQEFIFHGDIRNVYVGFTEFLSAIGGILSLFMGFSFISVAEMIYYAFLRPIFWWKEPENLKDYKFSENKFWLGNEIYRPKRNTTQSWPKNLYNDRHTPVKKF